MSLANGRAYLAIPGPSVVPDRVLRAMHRASPNIYTGELVEMAPTIMTDLRKLARTEGHVAVYIGNGHAAWEAALANTIAPGDRVVALVTGRFAQGWADYATRLGAEVETIDFGRRSPVDLSRFRAALDADRDHRIKAVLATQVDTATGVLNDVAALRGALDEAGHPALLMIDCIACFACEPFEMDAWGVDVMVSASQKGLMTPPGLGLVFFNGRANAARKALKRASPYWDWSPRAEPEALYAYFGGTAPTHHLYGLREALDMIAEEGVEAVWSRHLTLAQTIWAASEAWEAGGPLEINARDRSYRSRAVTALRIGAPRGKELRDWVERKVGLTLGIGLGMATPEDPNSDGAFRIGHMGHINAHMILGALSCIQAGLKALEIPFGPGALDAAAEVVANGSGRGDAPA